MTQWYVDWNYDRPTYAPNSNGTCIYWLENTGHTYLYCENVWLQFDWQEDQAYFQNCSVQIPPFKIDI